MGVVHKLQDEVRDFIVAQKKVFPQISCRKLSDVVYEKFEVVVSKSSISSVLQAANLSSPIGRHSLSVDDEVVLTKKSIKKFKIPEQKKSQIFPAHKIPTVKAPSKSIKVEIIKPTPPVLASKATISRYYAKDIPISTKQEMSNLKVEKKDTMSSKFLPSATVVVKNAGAIFLKAAEWDLAGGSILGKILKDELGGRFKVNFDQVADWLFLSEELETEQISNFDSTSWEWLVGTFDRSDDARKMREAVLKAAENISDCGMKLAIETEILLQEVAYIKIVNQNGDSIFIEAKSKEISFDNVQSDEAISFAPAMGMVGANIINNVHSAVFHCPADINSIWKMAIFLLSAFSNDSAQGIKEISLYNSQNAELAKYSYCPVKLRTFILVVPSWEKSFPVVLNSFRSGEPAIGLKILDKTFFYKKCSNDDAIKDQDEETKKRLHIIAISYSPTEKPCVVFLTNAADPVAIKKAVSDFLFSWAGLEHNDDSFPLNALSQREDYSVQVSSALALLDKATTLSESIVAFRQVIKVFCQRYFFAPRELSIDEDRLIGQVYGLPALLLDEEGIRCLSFTLAANDPLFFELKSAINRLNARVLFDPKGRRVVLRINPSVVS